MNAGFASTLPAFIQVSAAMLAKFVRASQEPLQQTMLNKKLLADTGHTTAVG